MTALTAPPRPLGPESGWESATWAHRVATLAAICYFGLLLAAYQLAPTVQFLDIFAVHLQYLPLALGGAAALAIASRRVADLHPGTRRMMRLGAVGLLLMACGMAGYIWDDALVRLAPWLADVGDILYVPGYLCIIGAVLVLPARNPRAYRGWQFALDTSVVLSAASLAMWYLVLRPTIALGTDGFDLFVRVAYPALGLGFLLAINVQVLRGGPVDRPDGVRPLALGMFCYVIADGCYQVLYYSSITPPVWAERANEVMYAGSYLLWCLGGIRLAGPAPARQFRWVREGVNEPVSPLPLLASGFVIALLLIIALVPWRPGTSPLLLGVAMLTGALVARLGYTSRRHADLLRSHERQKADARIAALVRHASDLIVVTEADARIRFASPSLHTMLGHRAEEVVGSWIGSLVHPDDRDALAAASAASAAPGSRTTVLRLIHRDGSTRECEVVATDLTTAPGVEGVVLVARDVTERRLLEAQLREAQKLEAVGRLSGGVAHDFNNLLTTILAETDLLLETATVQGRDELTTIRHATQQAATLTRQLLALSRQPSTNRVVEVGELVRTSVRMFLPVAPGVRVDQRVAADAPDALVDPYQVSQALLNLLLNARDATSQGGSIAIDVTHEMVTTTTGSWAVTPAPGRYLRIAVRDTGCGMSPEALARSFDPFFTTKAMGHGTGLGLPMVKRTIEQARGGLQVESREGAGTTITLYLPAAPEARGAGGEPAEVAAPRGRGRILLVDDEEQVRDVTRRLLERLGYAVETAASAAQARRVLEVGGLPDLLVTDVLMPGESGADLAGSVLRAAPGLPVLFISGYAGDELKRQGAIGDDVPLLQKPYTQQELGEQVRRALGRQPATVA
jgi:PAS domain S-box-containing protein